MTLYKATSEGNIPMTEKEERDILEEWNINKVINEKKKPEIKVTMLQARMALSKAGLLTKVNNAVSNGKEAVQISWEYAQNVDRNDPYLISICAMLDISDEQINSLFEEAAKL